MTRIVLDDEGFNEMWISDKDGERYEKAIEYEKQRKLEDFEESNCSFGE